MKCFEPLRISSLKALVILFFLANILSADVRIVLVPKAKSEAPLKLGSVAKIEGEGRFVHFLNSLPISKTVITDGIITKKEIIELLEKNYIDIKKIKIIGEKVVLFQKFRSIDDVIKNEAARLIAKEDPNMKIESLSIGKSIGCNGEECAIRCEVRSKTFRHIYLRCIIKSGESFQTSIPVTAKVLRFIKQPYAVRTIPKGKVITQEDVMYKIVRQYNSMQKSVEPSFLYGSVARRTILAGKPIRLFSIEPNFAVKKRKNVKIVYQKGAIRVELLGLALENGRIGDLVNVKNISTNKVLRCRVIGAGLVQYLRSSF